MDDPTLLTRGTYDVIAARYREKARDRAATLPHLEGFVRELARGARVLDLGTGPGFDLAQLTARGLTAIGLDFSMGMLRAGAAECPGVRIQGDARRLPLATAAFDGVWAIASMLHLSAADAGRAIAEAWRVLDRNGVLYVSVKAGSGTRTETDRYGLPRFFQYWSDAELDTELTARGFRVLRATTDVGDFDQWLTRLARRLP
jgi:ubiquinone/menaquinone biosynthesis C-methylase UbiE